jgi:hypothetical protein
VRSHKLSAELQPAALKVWLSKGKEYGAPPAAVHPIKEFTSELITYYRSLQPRSRLTSWPITNHFRPAKRTIPNNPEEWDQLMKGGPFGLFVILLGASWIDNLAQDMEDRAKLEALVDDLVWTLNKLVEVAGDENAVVKVSKGTKRKAAVDEGGKKKKKVKPV